MEESKARSPTRVGIALVREGVAYLVRRRPPTAGSPMPGLWEFPGGKCEPGESPAAATARECREEAGLAVVVERLRRVVTHHYPHGLIELHYFDCVPCDPEDQPAPGSGFRWMPARELPALEFPPANGPVLDELAAE
ncbi:MAG TPA: NUDIX domain-containing protein [Isosphaeraceae bacterium]|nr:NUDIX domain-containing protein [Isosphaeraceae bacterium]